MRNIALFNPKTPNYYVLYIIIVRCLTKFGQIWRGTLVTNSEFGEGKPMENSKNVGVENVPTIVMTGRLFLLCFKMWY